MATRGRPPGETARGRETRDRLYRTSLELFAQEGYEPTTLRDIARAAGVSPGLLYRYFPSKQALLLAFYDDLSARFLSAAAALPEGSWAARYAWALRESLATLGPHREVLRALNSILVSPSEDGLFGANTLFARRRVQGIFERAVQGARDAPPEPTALALGRLLYLSHLGVLLLWTLDRSESQRASAGLVALLTGSLSWLALGLALPFARVALREADALLSEALGL